MTRINSSKICKNLYILKIRGFSFYKIGITNDFKKRISNIKNSMPFKINIILLKKYDYAAIIEKQLFEKYKINRISGEWFSLTTNQISDIINILK